MRLDPAIRHLEATLTDDQQTVRNSLIELQTLGQMSAAGILATVAGLGVLATLMHHGQKRSHQRLRGAIDTMSDGFVHIDRNGRITVANDQLLRYLPRETLSVGGLGTAEGLAARSPWQRPIPRPHAAPLSPSWAVPRHPPCPNPGAIGPGHWPARPT
ncbi:hypothetical protein ACFQ4K_00265 [Tistrella bauzanensis]